MGILAISGAIVLAVGLVLTVVQFWREWDRVGTPEKIEKFVRDTRTRGVEFDAGSVKMHLTTTYIGALIAALGAVLLVVGALNGK